MLDSCVACLSFPWLRSIVLFLAIIAICYAFRVLCFGGGDPNHKDHDSMNQGRNLW